MRTIFLISLMSVTLSGLSQSTDSTKFNYRDSLLHHNPDLSYFFCDSLKDDHHFIMQSLYSDIMEYYYPASFEIGKTYEASMSASALDLDAHFSDSIILLLPDGQSIYLTPTGEGNLDYCITKRNILNMATFIGQILSGTVSFEYYEFDDDYNIIGWVYRTENSLMYIYIRNEEDLTVNVEVTKLLENKAVLKEK